MAFCSCFLPFKTLTLLNPYSSHLLAQAGQQYNEHGRCLCNFLFAYEHLDLLTPYPHKTLTLLNLFYP